MRVILSGSSGRAAYIAGERARIYDVNALPDITEFPASSLHYLFSGVRDLEEIPYTNDDDIIAKLYRGYYRDRALFLFLTLLDEDLSTDIRQATQHACEEILNDKYDAQTFIKNRLSSNPVQSHEALIFALEKTPEGTVLNGILEEINSLQEIIGLLNRSWNGIDIKIFGSLPKKNSFEKYLINNGSFYKACKAIAQGEINKVNLAKIDILQAKGLSDFQNSREIIASWINPFISSQQSVRSNTDYQKLLRSIENDTEDDVAIATSLNSFEVHQMVIAQVNHIKSQLQKMSLAKAEKFTNELVKQQIAREEQEHAAKSLCNIATIARETNQKIFAHGLNLRAVELSPSDGRAWAEYADACISIGHFEEAEKGIENAKNFGEALYATNSEIKILRTNEKYEQALQVCDLAIQQHHASDELSVLYTAQAMIYRDLQEHDKAIAAADNAIKSAPAQDPDPRCIKANLLREIGQLDEALDLYKETTLICSRKAEASVGASKVLREKGDFEGARQLITSVLTKYKDEVSIHKEYALVLRGLKRFGEALNLYDQLKVDFPFDYWIYVEKAHLLIELRKYHLVEKEFKAAEATVPVDYLFSIQYARALKAIGEAERSLHMFSQILKDYPGLSSGKLGQADALKELGQYEMARARYNNINLVRKTLVVTNSLDAINVAVGKSDEIIARAEPKPRTKSEWVSYHIYGMAHLQHNSVETALKIFQKGLSQVPFASQKPFFSTAIALCALKEEDYSTAEKMVGYEMGDLGQVILMHAYCGLGKAKELKSTYKDMNKQRIDSQVYSIFSELGAQLKLNKFKPRHNASWILEKECAELAIAMSSQKVA